MKEVQAGKVVLQDGRKIEYGLLVWSTGFGASDLVQQLTLKKDKERLLTDPHLRVLAADSQVLPDVYALGDCATVENMNHAATAQMAQQKGVYLARSLNDLAKGSPPAKEGFQYHHAGTLAYIGGWKALFQSEVKVSGFSAWLLWRSAYFTKTVSIKNKILIPMYWFLTFVFGRDTTRF